MSGPSFIVPTSQTGVSGIAQSDGESQDRIFFGEDIYFTTQPQLVNGGDEFGYIVDAAGDWTSVTGLEALRQSLLRRLITNPGEWQTKTNYGCGARSYVKGRNTEGQRSELASRIKAQFMIDPRVHSVDLVLVHPLDDGSDGLKVSVSVTPTGRLRTGSPLSFTTEVNP